MVNTVVDSVRELHKEAMSLAHLALVARERGKQARADLLTSLAYKLEARAADAVPDEKSSEPTRSILYRSAATLAYQCRALAAARDLIAKGRAGYPPPEIAQELHDLYQQVDCAQLLSKRGMA